jgi:parallel beta-helix repeat protein
VPAPKPRTIHVDGAATSSGYGTEEAPLKTISEAAAIALPGDTVRIAAGVYRESVTLPRGGTADAPITFESHGSVTICGSDPVTGWRRREVIDAEKTNGSERLAGVVFKVSWSFESGESTPAGMPLKPIAHSPDWLRCDLVAVDDRILLMVDDYDSLVAGRPWTFFIDRAKKPSTLYIKLPKGIDPDTSRIEAATRSVLFNVADDPDIGYITLRGIRFLHAANAAQNGMVRAKTGWVLEDCRFEASNGLGLKIEGNDVVARRCKFMRNGHTSFAASGSNRLLMENCDFGFNNWRGFNTAWEASNKVYGCDGVVIRNCRSFWNCGPGLWVDFKNRNIEISGCEIFGNYGLEADGGGTGVFIEISYGPVSIRNNIIYSNTGAGILLAESQDITAESNSLADNGCALAIRFMQNRPEHQTPTSSTSPDPPFILENIVFTGNEIYPQRNAILQTEDHDWTPEYARASNIVVESNRYHGMLPQDNYARNRGARPPLHSLINARNDAGNSRAKLGFDRTASVISQPFRGITMPSYRQANRSAAPGGAFPPELLAHTPGYYVIPVVRRDEIIAELATSAGYCQVYDLYDQPLRVTLSNEIARRLVGCLPLTPLTQPVFLKVEVGKAEPGASVVPSLFSWNPAPVAGKKVHRSDNIAGAHQHFFWGAETPLSIDVDDQLVCYVHLDIEHPPRQVMLQWQSSGGRLHRAFWGENLLHPSIGTTRADNYKVGPLPEAGRWVRLEVPATTVGLVGKQVGGMAFALYNGRAWWDGAGKRPPGASVDAIWLDDNLPNGAMPGAISDSWHWESGSVE